MLSNLNLINFISGKYIALPGDTQAFCLKTCQRNLYLTLNEIPILPAHSHYDDTIDDEAADSTSPIYFNGEAAYTYLLEVICGLHSKIVGETEIVSQFKEAIRHYLKSPHRSPQILRLLEKLLQDSKEIRTQYLHGISKNSYAYLARKIIQGQREKAGKSPAQANEKVLVLGTGMMANDIINQLNKKYQLHLTARNSDKIVALCHSNPFLEPVRWQDLEAYSEFKIIISCVNSPSPLFTHEFFQYWKAKHATQVENGDKNQDENEGGQSPLFIDFASPSVIETSFEKDQNIYRLGDFFEYNSSTQSKNLFQIQMAKQAIYALSKKRSFHHKGLIKNPAKKNHQIA